VLEQSWTKVDWSKVMTLEEALNHLTTDQITAVDALTATVEARELADEGVNDTPLVFKSARWKTHLLVRQKAEECLNLGITVGYIALFAMSSTGQLPDPVSSAIRITH